MLRARMRVRKGLSHMLNFKYSVLVIFNLILLEKNECLKLLSYCKHFWADYKNGFFFSSFRLYLFPEMNPIDYFSTYKNYIEVLDINHSKIS